MRKRLLLATVAAVLILAPLVSSSRQNVHTNSVLSGLANTKLMSLVVGASVLLAPLNSEAAAAAASTSTWSTGVWPQQLTHSHPHPHTHQNSKLRNQQHKQQLHYFSSKAKSASTATGWGGAPTLVSLLQEQQSPQRQSPGWEAVRQKRTQAIKEMELKGIVRVSTDDAGNQFLALPWLPDRKIPYKSLPLSKRLQNEVCAGAFGEISKDVLLHGVDTLKTRRQAAKKTAAAPTTPVGLSPIDASSGSSSGGGGGGVLSMTSVSGAVEQSNKEGVLSMLQGLYAGFPVVLVSSIPQGGAFFLVKKSIIEALNVYTPDANAVVVAVVPIVFSVMAYWLFRTPAEVIKTQVQTRQSGTCLEAVEEFRRRDEGLRRLWRYYPVMLVLDIPFQVLNFAMLTVLSDAVSAAGVPVSILSRLFCGVTCGMTSAGVTCPIDVCKTRILARDKAAADVLTPVRAVTHNGQDAGDIDSVFGATGSVELAAGALQSSSSEGESVELLLSAGGVGGTRQPPSSHDSTDSPSTTSAITSSAVVVTTDENSASSGDSRSDSSGSPHVHINMNTNSNNGNVFKELVKIYSEEGPGTLFLGLRQRLLYTGLANGIRLAAYGTSRMDLMMRSLDAQ